MLAILEDVAELAVLAVAHQLPEGGEEHGVLARLVRPVHAREAAQQPGSARAVRRAGEELRGYSPAGGVLCLQRGHQLRLAAGLAEAGEELLLLELLVVALDEIADDLD